MTDLLETALNDLVPTFVDEPPDWNDILARSSTPPRRTSFVSRRRPRRAAVIAFALVLIALLATPAFGVQSYVLHLLGRKNVSFSNSPAAPNVVKKQFLDLPLGAPRSFAPQVKAAQTRIVATFSIAGHPRKLWARSDPAGRLLLHVREQLRRLPPDPRRPLDRRQGPVRRHLAGRIAQTPGVNESIVTRVGGDITAPAAAKITATYADGTTGDIPFVWVSSPIAAGFYTYDIPTAHWNKQHRLLALTLYAKNGTQLGRQTFPYVAHPPPGEDSAAGAHRHAEAARAADRPDRAAVGPNLARLG